MHLTLVWLFQTQELIFVSNIPLFNQLFILDAIKWFVKKQERKDQHKVNRKFLLFFSPFLFPSLSFDVCAFVSFFPSFLPLHACYSPIRSSTFWISSRRWDSLTSLKIGSIWRTGAGDPASLVRQIAVILVTEDRNLVPVLIAKSPFQWGKELKVLGYRRV